MKFCRLNVGRSKSCSPKYQARSEQISVTFNLLIYRPLTCFIMKPLCPKYMGQNDALLSASFLQLFFHSYNHFIF